MYFLVDGGTPSNESRRVLAAQPNKKLSESAAFNLPPWTPVEHVVETLHGVEVADPYRWLEDQHSPQTRQWLVEQAAYTRAYFDRIPGRERIRVRAAQLLDVEVVTEPRKVGDRYFFLKRTAQQEQPIIMMREGVTGADIPLVDPTQMGQGPSIAVGILGVSNDGKLLAYSVRHGGEDSCAIGFLDVDQRQVLPDGLPHGFCRGLAFSPNNEGFFYIHRPVGGARPHYRAVCWHSLGAEFSSDTEIFFAGEDPQLHLGMFASPDGRFLAYFVISVHNKRTVDFYLHDLATGEPPRKIVSRMEGIFVPTFLEDKLVALTDWEAPNGRVVAIDPNRPQTDAWKEIVPEAGGRIRDFAVVGGLIFAGYVENLSTDIAVFDPSGKQRDILGCPPQGTVHTLPSPPNSDVLFYRSTSFGHPPTIFRYHTQTGERDAWEQSQVPFDPASVEVEQVRYPSKDGTLVPMFLVSQKGRRRQGPLPTFLTGYGGFGTSITPQFTAYATCLMEQGCLFAVANLRGGSEFGRQWHEAGKRHNRQNAIDDFLAAAEWLVAQGHAAPGRVAIGGGSNAGLLMGAALTQRPDLFRAVVCLGPLLDMLRYQLFDFANMWMDEYGSAENEDDFHHLLAYSPYHRVIDGVAYPAVMLISGDADTRCNPMHTRKMAAKLQAATSSAHAILLDYRTTWGHMPVQPLSSRIEAFTNRLAFLCHELGLNV
ncbi:MAG: prolyl oligopeptidase family serine peptidase [Acidobacteria bacterium]|nr:prolyl oligopeptidase family serine peptidase [Acidobacteriota bacterium]